MARSRGSRQPRTECLAKIAQRALLLSIGHRLPAIPHEHGLPRARTPSPSDYGSEYDYTLHRKGLAKLRLGHPSVRLESLTLASSTTDPQNSQVVPGPGSSGIGWSKSSLWSRCLIRARQVAGSCSESQPERCGVTRSARRGDGGGLGLDRVRVRVEGRSRGRCRLKSSS